MSIERATPAKSVKVFPSKQNAANLSELLKQYGLGPIPFFGTENALYERHLVFDRVIDPAVTSARERFEAFSRSVRDILSQRWVLTKKTYEHLNAKRIYYLSLEFLIGRSLANNITNLLLDPIVEHGVREKGMDLLELIEQEFLFLPETEAPYPRWRRIVRECGVSGVQVHDARLAAVMNVNNISYLLTLNPRDFQRFSGFTPVHPDDLQPRAT